jgi:hypothetical protein
MMRKTKLALEEEHALRVLSKQAILTKYRKIKWNIVLTWKK